MFGKGIKSLTEICINLQNRSNVSKAEYLLNTQNSALQSASVKTETKSAVVKVVYSCRFVAKTGPKQHSSRVLATESYRQVM